MGAFRNRFALGFPAANGVLPAGPIWSWLIAGLLVNGPGAIITKAYVPVIVSVGHIGRYRRLGGANLGRRSGYLTRTVAEPGKMRFMTIAGQFKLWILLAMVTPPGAVACNHTPSPLEREVFIESNLARTNPGAYSRYIDELKALYRGKGRSLPGNVTLQTEEGVNAVAEAARALRATRPMAALALDPCLSLSALAHIHDIGPKGLLTHESSRGENFADRIYRHAPGYRAIGENMGFGDVSGRDLVTNLLIDDGQPSRGHRKNMLSPEFRFTGVACGPHRQYGTMCVVEYGTR